MKHLVLWVLFGSVATYALANMNDKTASQISVTTILRKNVDARGGLKAWRQIKTMAWVGHIESANSPVHSMPFVLKMKRPNKTRFEIKAENRVSIRMYDGNHGWKLRPGRTGLPDLKPYTKVELNYAHDVYGIDGPLIDYQKKGIKVSLDGVEQVEGRKAYRLNVTMPSGNHHHVWIDARTFLDVKYDRTTRNAMGMSATLDVAYRDYRTINGVKIPFSIESGTSAGKPAYKMVVDKVFINPPLSDAQFRKPNIPKPRSNRIRVQALPDRPKSHSSWPIKPVPPGMQSTRPTLAGNGKRH